MVRTDGWNSYNTLTQQGYMHDPMVFEGDPERMDAHLPMIHITFSNLKTWLQGAHHSVGKQHLQAYLDEFVFRYNRRFYPITGFASILGIGIEVSAQLIKSYMAANGITMLARRGLNYHREYGGVSTG